MLITVPEMTVRDGPLRLLRALVQDVVHRELIRTDDVSDRTRRRTIPTPGCQMPGHAFFQGDPLPAGVGADRVAVAVGAAVLQPAGDVAGRAGSVLLVVPYELVGDVRGVRAQLYVRRGRGAGLLVGAGQVASVSVAQGERVHEVSP
ncbi:hypothetical protein A6A29_40205 [Streptomyces sp. TSRI0281]|nr:hypothetical protein A6A29_40205 [Streptomyces sp. TSRI0281]